MFYGAADLPVLCHHSVEGGQTCRQELAWGDVTKLSPADALAASKQRAVQRFALEHPRLVRWCPQAGCEQLLRVRPAPESAPPVADCASCVRSYCVACSERAGKAVDSHAGESCEDASAGTRNDVAAHLAYITEQILTIHCPRCRQAFHIFDGCFAIACAGEQGGVRTGCGASFCGFCLKDCGDNAHPHVKQCPLNPSPGSYGGTFELFTNTHRDRRAAEVRDYLARIEEPLWGLVQRQCRRHFEDLGIVL